MVCTQFLPTALLERERRGGRCRARILTVVTDFEVHGMWLAAPSDHYCVATAAAEAHLHALGIARGAITVSGIHTHPVIFRGKRSPAMCRKHGWCEDLPAILVSAGGFGAGNAEPMIELLMDSPASADRRSLRKGCRAEIVDGKVGDARNEPESPVLKVVGFTTEMDEFMAASDLMIGKPRGLTTSESPIKELACLVVSPIAGQEERNAIYLLEQGVGVWSDNLYTLRFRVRQLLEQPGRLAAMRKNALRAARPGAGALVAGLATHDRSAA